MIKKPDKSVARKKRHERIRNHVFGTAARPRLAVFRSNSHIYAQIINDEKGHTLCAASTMQKDVIGSINTWDIEAAKIVGKMIAKRALDLGIKQIVFDRGGYIYHGKVKALGDAAREAGLEF